MVEMPLFWPATADSAMRAAGYQLMSTYPVHRLQNVVAIPLVMVEIICSQPQLEGIEECFETGASFIFVYLVGWSVLFWTGGVYAIRYFTHDDDGSPPAKHDDQTMRSECLRAGRSILNPPFIGILVGLLVGLVKPLKVRDISKVSCFASIPLPPIPAN